MTPPRGARADTRRAATRVRLLDAAVEVLVERGLDGFTTPVVAALAGTSQGTVFRHFPSKRDLLVATTARTLESCRADHATRFSERIAAEQPTEADGVIRIAIEALWNACVDPRSLALTEVRARCRTDHELRDALTDVIGTENATSGDLVPLLLPAAFQMAIDDYVETTRIVLNAMAGRALAGLARPDPARDHAVVESLIALVQDRYHRGLAAQPTTTRDH